MLIIILTINSVQLAVAVDNQCAAGVQHIIQHEFRDQLHSLLRERAKFPQGDGPYVRATSAHREKRDSDTNGESRQTVW